MSRVLSLVLLTAIASSVHAQAQPEPLVLQVKKSIHKGVEYLVKQQLGDGSWDQTQAAEDTLKIDFSGGSTGLAVLALLNCEDVIDDPALEKRRLQAINAGINRLRQIKGNTVYVRSLQTMALAEAKVDIPVIKANVKWLIDARVFRDKQFVGWDYRPNGVAADASNTQYAMLALWYARQVPGVEVPREVWQSIHDHYRRTQSKNGYWIYSPFYGDVPELTSPSISMTIAGLCGLYIAGSELGRGNKCGEYPDDRHIAKALEWLNGNPAKKIPSKFTYELESRTYYHLYGLERAGRLSGMRFFGEHDWYREGCELLVKKQDANGSWPKGSAHDRWPHVNTAFALLFLSKGRTPVVISKLVHGNWPRREDDTDWNNDRNDLRHLTESLPKTENPLFGKRPVAWQTYDIMRALYARGNQPGVKDEDAVVADMRQAPILYITGHETPLRRLQDRENALIKRFVDNGGFLFAEACCGDKDFDAGIKEWVKENWPGHELTYVESTHPVWTSYHTLKAGDPYKLMSLQAGCRTIMLYSPQDLSCHWESNQTSQGASKRAFELGANIIAYGTGRTRPQPRLTPIDIAGAMEKTPKRPSQRGFFQVGQIYHQGDWQPAPRAMTNVLEHVHKVADLDVMLKTERILLGDPSTVIGTKFLYMHGRQEFRVDAKHLEALRFTLESGGLLLADACCGSETFDKSFRKFAQDLFPKEKLVLLSTDPDTRDPLFGDKLNGELLTAANIKCRPKVNGPMQAMAPHVEGIRVNGRWAVLYSKYDLGCALERNTSPDCVGYDHVSALKIATAAVLYNARP